MAEKYTALYLVAEEDFVFLERPDERKNIYKHYQYLNGWLTNLSAYTGKNRGPSEPISEYFDSCEILVAKS